MSPLGLKPIDIQSENSKDIIKCSTNNTFSIVLSGFILTSDGKSVDSFLSL